MNTHYITQFIKDPRVASLAPSSDSTIRKILQDIDFRHTKTIVEYGPGNGILTRQLLRNMRIDTRLIVIETNRSFTDYLQNSIDDRRLTIVNDSALNICQILKELDCPPVDVVISGIPLSFLSKHAVSELIGDTARLLNVRGSLIMYQTLIFPITYSFLRTTLNREFITTKSSLSLLNFPPLYILKASRPHARALAMMNAA